MRGLLHGSVVAAATDVKVGAMVGDTFTVDRVGDGGMGVSVGNDVGTEVFVGGMAVSVGIAACVSATIVNAAATAVDCVSSGLNEAAVGAELPHALSNRLSMAIPAQAFFFI